MTLPRNKRLLNIWLIEGLAHVFLILGNNYRKKNHYLVLQNLLVSKLCRELYPLTDNSRFLIQNLSKELLLYGYKRKLPICQLNYGNLRPKHLTKTWWTDFLILNRYQNQDRNILKAVCGGL